ncbi:MAG: guanylate kinase [Lachnospiraceae bacterium]
MGKIYYIMGKSSSGKDTIYKKLMERMRGKLKTVTGYTTRPMREGETDGVEYFFVTREKYREMKSQGIVIESRDYNTVYGVWTYFTADDGQIELEKSDYLLIGTLESYKGLRDYYGKEKIIPLYIEADDGDRLLRAIKREKKQEAPGYEEMCRRFLADQQDFCEERLTECGIIRRYKNIDLEKCIEEICSDIYG